MEGDAVAVPSLSNGEDGDQQTVDITTEDGAEETPAGETPESADEHAESTELGASRLGDRQVIGICVLLVVLAAGLGLAGYLGLRSHAASSAIARDNAAAVEAAKYCVLASQAPDGSDPAAAQQKILSCAAGEFGTQAALYAQLYVGAYEAAKVHVTLTEMGAAVERDNPDGSIDVLVAFRVKVDNVETRGKEVGYRLRARMIREDGQYRIAKLDQVAR